MAKDEFTRELLAALAAPADSVEVVFRSVLLLSAVGVRSRELYAATDRHRHSPLNDFRSGRRRE